MDNTSLAVKEALDLPLMASLMETTFTKTSGGEYSPKSDPSLHLNLSKGTYHDKSGKHGQGDFIRLLQSWNKLPSYDAAGDMARDALGMRRWGDAKPLTDTERATYAKQRQEAQAQREARQREIEAREAEETVRKTKWAKETFEGFPELPVGYALEDVPCPAFDYLQRRGWTHETTGRHIDYADVRTHGAFNFASKGETPETSPAVLFAIRNTTTGEVQGYQALGHTLEGHKASFASGRPAKKSLGLIKGGTVHLSRWDYRPPEIGICEGIGDALAIAKRGFTHIRASLGVVDMPLLEWVNHLWIFPDRDDNGQGMEAAESLAQRWIAAGKDVTMKPAPMGFDWGACV